MAADRRAEPRSFFDSPVSAGTCVLAVGVTLLYWSGKNISPITMSPAAFGREPWRLVTSALVHASYREMGFTGIFHILFNVIWTWRFGNALESRYGSLKTFLLFVMLAAGAGAAEFALFGDAIGLSGVGYGLFGFLWVARRRTTGFDDVIDRRVTVSFVAWFFFCIVATRFGAMNVANVAHGAGCALGAVAGGAATARTPSARSLWGAGLAGLVGLCFAGATVLRPTINPRGYAQEKARAAFELVEGDPAKAVELYQAAIKRSPDEPNYWFNLGVSLSKVQRNEEAENAFEHACQLSTTLEARNRYCLENLRKPR